MGSFENCESARFWEARQPARLAPKQSDELRPRRTLVRSAPAVPRPRHAAARAVHRAGVETLVGGGVKEGRAGGQMVGDAAYAARGLERMGVRPLVEAECLPVQRPDSRNWRGQRVPYMPIQEVARDLGTRT